MNLAKDTSRGEPWSLSISTLDPSDGTLYQRRLLHDDMRRLRQEDPVHWSLTGPRPTTMSRSALGCIAAWATGQPKCRSACCRRRS